MIDVGAGYRLILPTEELLPGDEQHCWNALDGWLGVWIGVVTSVALRPALEDAYSYGPEGWTHYRICRRFVAGG